MSTMTDREMLELAAVACGQLPINWKERKAHLTYYFDGVLDRWNPLANDGDALRLAVKLNLDIRYESYDAGIAVIVGAAWDGAPEAVHEIFERDGACALRRAIVRAAAEIGRSKHE